MEQWVYAVGLDTALQAEWSRVLFLMEVIGMFHWLNPSSRTRASGIGLASDRNEYQGFLLRAKAADVYC